ncbi:MAG TPA: hypothetical protein VJZ32_08135 [Candidatus Bathyarchaeia archaeon]|nr:hypothetical protein [Candidatus Bathyarchaeia archaeon]
MKEQWVKRNFIDAKRLPLFGPFWISWGPMVSLAQRIIIVIVGSWVITAMFSAILQSWLPLLVAPLPVLASYLFWHPRYQT